MTPRLPALCAAGRVLLSTALVVALASCGALRSPNGGDRYWVPPGAAQSGSDAGSLLHYYGYVSALNGTQADQERERQRRAWSADKSDFRRIQYAIALAGPSATASERRLSAQLLEAIARQAPGHDPELHWLAVVLSRDAELQRRLDATTRELERKAEAMKELERKLDAMKAIELQLLQRGRTPGQEAKP